MESLRNQRTQYPDDGSGYPPPQERLLGTQPVAGYYQHGPVQQASAIPYASSIPDPSLSQEPSHDVRLTNEYSQTHPDDPDVQQDDVLAKAAQKKRLIWLIPLAIIAIVLLILFQVYKSDFERWISPLTNWLRQRESWSWVIPVAIMFIMSFPPLFGQELVLLIVGLAYPLGVALGIAALETILGESGCFILFKYVFTKRVAKKIATNNLWAATARVAQDAGFKGVLLFRYSLAPPHLLNPLFACTGMKFWLYMVTVILSLPKTMIFVALGNSDSETSKVAKYGKILAILVVVGISIYASKWIKQKMEIAIKEIKMERANSQGGEELDMLNAPGRGTRAGDTSYQGVSGKIPKVTYSSGGT